MEKSTVKELFGNKIKLEGEIKKFPEDFIVEEVREDGRICRVSTNIIEELRDLFREKKYSLIPSSRKEQVHFTLVKKNWTTQRAVSEVTHRLRVSRKRMGYAGTKDRRAITAQRVSAWNINVEQVRKIKIKDIKIKNIEYSDKRLTLGDLSGNKFSITVRGAKKIKPELIKKSLENGVPNFFGKQRFGIQRNVTHLIGKQVLLGNFEGAAMIMITSPGDENEESSHARKFAGENWGKWKEILNVWPKNLGLEASVLNYLVKYPNDYANAIRKLDKRIRRLFVHAYQSWIFNKVLEDVIEKGIFAETIPLVGYESELDGEIGNMIKKILKDEQVTLNHFKIKRMPEISERGSERKTRIGVNDVSVKWEKDLLMLGFFLEKGAYATTVLEFLGVNV